MKSFILLCFSFIVLNLHSQAQNLINHKGNDIFFSGINLAWMEFGNDLTGFNKENFTAIMDNVAASGGNSVRWWIHVDGRSTPTYVSDTVVGISEVGLTNLELALDIAAERGIVVSLCLWSFDMLAKQKTGESEAVALARIKKNKILLEDSAATQAYIDSALIPMVNKVKGHTAILCWEIFNEPEGMTSIASWSHIETVNMVYIQRFINRCAGAIHRTDPSAKVSNGSWNAVACSDISAIIGSTNYYSNQELINAGGDTDGYLDFYMLHYYAEWYGDKYSPFHNPIAYWELDKPLLIGEFAAHGIIHETGKNFAPTSELSSTEAMAYLYDNGYAGGWGWTYTNHDGNGGLADMAYVLDSLKKTHPEFIIIPRDPNHNYAPKSTKQIQDTILFVNSNPITNYLNLDDYFIDEAQLTYSIKPHGPALISITNNSFIDLSVIADSTGISKFTVIATDNGGKTASLNFCITVRDTTITSDNKLLFAFVSSSSQEDTINRRPLVNDGDMTTRWSSIYNDNEWIQFDMLEEFSISRIKLFWEAAYGDKFEIFISTDKTNWTSVYNNGNGQPTINNIVFEPILSRYIRIEFKKRATKWGYSLYEVEAYENSGILENIAPNSISSPLTRTFNSNYNYTYLFPRSKFTDANNDILTLSAKLADGSPLPSAITFNSFTNEFNIFAELSDTGTYIITITATDWFGETANYNMTIKIVPTINSFEALQRNKPKLYPNPNSESICAFSIPANYNNNVQVIITNSLGKKINTQNVVCSNGKGEFNIKNVSPGLYFICIQTAKNKYTETLIVQ